MLYFYNNQFGVCGTGRTTEKLILNNNQEASIGYYDNDKVLQDISFNINKNIALVNNVLDKTETDKYDYNIYGYDGSVDIKIDGKEYSLKEALLENKITMEEIIEKANQDEKDGKIRTEMYKDGGSMEYHYENYTIIKWHTLDGNKDVYIGNKDLKLSDII